MASNVILKPTCDLCCELYTDPRMLPCLHSFCKKCIEKHIEEQGSKEALECPTCKEEAVVPPEGVEAIPQDVRASYEAEVKRFELKITSSTEEKCEVCIREDSGYAVAFCANCREFLCKRCKEDHAQLRKTRTHELVVIGKQTEPEPCTLPPPHKKPRTHDHIAMGKNAVESFTLPLPQPILCGQLAHKENLDYYCETCETLICRDCVILDHSGHSYNLLERFAEKEKADLLSCIDQASDAMQKIEEAMTKRDKFSQQVEERKKAVDEAITSSFDQFHEALQKRKEALLAKSTEISLGKTSTFAIENNEFKRMQEKIDSTCQLIRRAVDTYTPRQVLAIKKLMKAKLVTLLKKFQEVSHEPTTTAAMPMTLDVSPLLTDIATLGAVAGGSCPWMATAVIYIPRATVNKERKIKVTARDDAGKPYPHGGDIVKGSVGLLGSSDSPTDGTTTDNGDGTYVISFTPSSTGENELRMAISGQQIKGSPFVISVHQERDYQSLSGYQQVFRTASTPWDVAVHDSGDLYVACHGSHCIYVLTSSGTHKRSFGTQGNGQGQFSQPAGIALRGDVLYVTENKNNRVQKLSIEGEHLAFIGQGQFRNPRGICLHPDGRIFVADYSKNRVQVFNEDGSHAYSITGNSAEGSNLTNPWGVAIDAEGQLHVVNYGSSVVRIFTVEGKYVTTYGSGNFSYQPAGIAVDEEGYSFVTEYYQYNYGRLHVFNPQHQCIHSTTCSNGLNHPVGVTIDKEGFVWVADSSNSQIKRL